MAAHFLDSSTIVKRYVRETGTVWVTSFFDPKTGSKLYAARISGDEVVSAIIRRTRSGSLSVQDAAKAIAQFRLEYTSVYRFIELTPPVIARAMSLAETHALRGYDAVQLATALELNDRRVARRWPPLTLLSADLELNAAASSEGLLVDNPNLHP